jgi:hypothetical protein
MKNSPEISTVMKFDDFVSLPGREHTLSSRVGLPSYLNDHSKTVCEASLTRKEDHHPRAMPKGNNKANESSVMQAIDTVMSKETVK